jgi:hypothetical protein
LTIASRGTDQCAIQSSTVFNSPGRKAGDRSAKCAARRSIPGLPAGAIKCLAPPLLAMAKARNSSCHLPRSDLVFLLRPGKSCQQNKKSQDINEEDF